MRYYGLGDARVFGCGRSYPKGQMPISVAAQKGGEVTAGRYGQEFYEEIGHKGGQKTKRLIENGKRALAARGIDWRTME